MSRLVSDDVGGPGLRGRGLRPMWVAAGTLVLAVAGASAHGQSPAACVSYDRWSVLEAGPILAGAMVAIDDMDSCSGADYAACNAIYETGMEALDHVIQVFNGAAADSRNDCLRCDIGALLLPAAAGVTELGHKLEAKGYPSAASLVGVYATVSSWRDTPYCGRQAADCSFLDGAWRMGGPYNIGRPTRIAASPANLLFTNENGQSSRGSCGGADAVTALDWGQLVGRVSPNRKRIDWANGTWWVR